MHHEFYNGNFLLLPGSIKFSFLKLTSDDKGRECRNYGVWGKMLDMIAAAYQLDHIIIDLVSLSYCLFELKHFIALIKPMLTCEGMHRAHTTTT